MSQCRPQPPLDTGKPPHVKFLMQSVKLRIQKSFIRSSFIMILFLAFLVSGCASVQKNDTHYIYEKAPIGSDHFAMAGGYNIHYVEAGNGEPVILIPGAFSTYRVWNRVIPRLSRGYRVFALDYVGVGDSDKPESGFDYSVGSQADVIADLIKSQKLARVRLVGVSYGSAIALNIAVRYPELVENVTCIEGGAYIMPEQLKHSKSTALLGIPIIGDFFLGALKTGIFDRVAAKGVMDQAWDRLEQSEKQEVINIIATNLRTASRKAWYRIYRSITSPMDFTAELNKSTVPIRYLYGEQSKYIEVSRTNAEIIRRIAFNSEIIPFRDGIHDLELQYPGKVFDAITASWGNTELASDLLVQGNN